jgi:hypothetical protein
MRSLALSVFFTACGPSYEPKLSVIQREVFSVSCTFSSCHDGPYTESRLDLRPGKSYAALVGVQSQHNPAYVLVVAGDADASYLVDKVYGIPVPETVDHPDHDHSVIMPPADVGVLAEGWKKAIREWVARGAPND